jgi:hypothetical protein
MLYKSIVSKLFKFIRIFLTYLAVESTNYKIIYTSIKRYNFISGSLFLVVVLSPFI